jgi:hypothetical protein
LAKNTATRIPAHPLCVAARPLACLAHPAAVRALRQFSLDQRSGLA